MTHDYLLLFSLLLFSLSLSIFNFYVNFINE